MCVVYRAGKRTRCRVVKLVFSKTGRRFEITMKLKTVIAALTLSGRFSGGSAEALVSRPGHVAQIPKWSLQQQSRAGALGSDLAQASAPGADVSQWHHVDSPFCTVVACLLDTGLYNDTHLFFSDNLNDLDTAQFSEPWIYHHEFEIDPAPGQHYFLQTHGISSRADIFLNGKQIADRTAQAGSYAGYRYDITNVVAKANGLAIRAYPTDYDRELALGWVDWNPQPADNGTGVWRAVEIKQTGAVVLDALRITTEISTPVGSDKPAVVTLRTKARNLGNAPIRIEASAYAVPAWGAGGAGGNMTWSKMVDIPALSTVDIVFDATVQNPRIWWPKQWGEQPLYHATFSARTVDQAPLDSVTATFGFRSITSKLNSFNDTTFYINGLPFQVLGGGYAPDMFLRWDAKRWERELQYVLDLGFNTVRLEGKNQHPELYDIADRLGVMLMVGWECCDKWEAWSYNDHLSTKYLWNDADYSIANASMVHEAAMLQPHPSVLTFLIGSDFVPDERATTLYLNAFRAVNWQTPVIAAASKRGSSPQTGPSGLKMEGPYDWVPSNYWWEQTRLGSAFGFGSELGAGVGTPELSSLQKFLSPSDLEDLWKRPNKGLFHMSTAASSFHTREIYNTALWKRLGAPVSLEDYVQKAQISDYEATRSQFEAFAANWNARRPATGLIYWMLTNAFPSLHWNIWDYYMRPAGSFFGAKVGSRLEHVAYDYQNKAVYLINRSKDRSGKRTVQVQVIDTAGKVLYNSNVDAITTPNTSKNIASLATALAQNPSVVFLKLVLTDDKGVVLSRNVYWLAKSLDTLDWANSDWYYTPVTRYSDYTALNSLAPATVSVSTTKATGGSINVTLENKSDVPAFFVSLSLVDAARADVLPLTWSDNYVTLWPREKLTVAANVLQGGGVPAAVLVVGKNVAKSSVSL